MSGTELGRGHEKNDQLPMSGMADQREREKDGKRYQKRNLMIER